MTLLIRCHVAISNVPCYYSNAISRIIQRKLSKLEPKTATVETVEVLLPEVLPLPRIEFNIFDPTVLTDHSARYMCVE